MGADWITINGRGGGGATFEQTFKIGADHEGVRQGRRHRGRGQRRKGAVRGHRHQRRPRQRLVSRAGRLAARVGCPRDDEGDALGQTGRAGRMGRVTGRIERWQESPPHPACPARPASSRPIRLSSPSRPILPLPASTCAADERRLQSHRAGDESGFRQQTAPADGATAARRRSPRSACRAARRRRCARARSARARSRARPAIDPVRRRAET